MDITKAKSPCRHCAVEDIKQNDPTYLVNDHQITPQQYKALLLAVMKEPVSAQKDIILKKWGLSKEFSPLSLLQTFFIPTQVCTFIS